MTDDGTLPDRLRNMVRNPNAIGTHSAACWQWHDDCALLLAADRVAERDADVSAGAVARTVAMSHIAAERDAERAARERAEAEARQLREAIEDRLRQVLAVHGQFLGDWDEWTSLGALEGYNGLTVTARTALAHLHGRHDDSPLPTMHCVLCETFRVPAVAEGAEDTTYDEGGEGGPPFSALPSGPEIAGWFIETLRAGEFQNPGGSATLLSDDPQCTVWHLAEVDHDEQTHHLLDVHTDGTSDLLYVTAGLRERLGCEWRQKPSTVQPWGYDALVWFAERIEFTNENCGVPLVFLDPAAVAEGAEDRPAIPKFPGLHDRPDTGKECHYLAVTMPHGGLFCNKCGWAEGAEGRGQTDG